MLAQVLPNPRIQEILAPTQILATRIQKKTRCTCIIHLVNQINDVFLNIFMLNNISFCSLFYRSRIDSWRARRGS